MKKNEEKTPLEKHLEVLEAMLKLQMREEIKRNPSSITVGWKSSDWDGR